MKLAQGTAYVLEISHNLKKSDIIFHLFLMVSFANVIILFNLSNPDKLKYYFPQKLMLGGT